MEKKLYTYQNLSYEAKDNCKLDIYSVKNTKKTVIYIHGGGLTSGNKIDEGADLFKELIKDNISVVSVEYSLYPNTKFPDFIYEVAYAIKWILKNANDYNLNSDYTIFGTSAGAYIAMMLCFDDKYFKKANVEVELIKNFVFHSPQPTVHFRVLEEYGLDSRRVIIDNRSPIYYIEEKKYPNILLIFYTNDILGRYEQCKMLSKTLTHHNVKHKAVILEGEHCSGQFYNKDGKLNILSDLLHFIK